MRILRKYLTLRLDKAGVLTPWLGPALRGLLAHLFKNRVCVHPVAERDTRWIHCKGCPHLQECDYGVTFEPDPPPGTSPSPGREDVIRPVVLAPWFPQPLRAPAGHSIAIRLTVIGDRAIRAVPSLLTSLTEAGQTQGLGADGLTFSVTDDPAWDDAFDLSGEDLPRNPGSIPGYYRSVRIQLTSPLFLRQERSGGQRLQDVQLVDLVRASVRTVSELFRLYSSPIEAEYRALIDLAREVIGLDHNFTRCTQPHFSSRGKTRYDLQGLEGEAIYHAVPAVLIPWLYWGGQWHSGGHRVMGAGSWQLSLD